MIMCQQQFDAEVQDEELQYEEKMSDFGEMLFELGCYMNRVRVEEIEADLEAHKQAGYVERMYEQADLRRKANRENGNG